jgi:hypothetical protein
MSGVVISLVAAITHERSAFAATIPRKNQLTCPTRRCQSGMRQRDDDVSRGLSSVITSVPSPRCQSLTAEVPAEQAARRSPG